MKRNLPTPETLLTAIRARCLDCCGNSRLEVGRCKTASCPLHPYRCGNAAYTEQAQQVLPGQIDWLDSLKINRKAV